jgi:pyruvate kinase
MHDEPDHGQRPSLTKIIATVGPATNDVEALGRLAETGVSIFRLNFSHGTLEEHADRLRAIRAVEQQQGRPLAALGDLSGPKIRIGAVPGDGIHVEVGQDVRFVTGDDPAEDGAVPVFRCTYEPLVDEVEPGHKILINDGAVRMLAVGRGEGELTCRVLVGGRITSGKGVNLPNTTLSAPALTEKDWRCVDWAIEHGIDMLALSFVRSADDVRQLKHHLAEHVVCDPRPDDDVDASAYSIPVISKIERPEAIHDIDDIVEASDAVMVARGDLGVEMDLAEVPVIQKSILRRCQFHGTPCIVATQMLQSMIEAPAPTRAEASDVANAIFDGTDAVMLSGETAVGAYPSVTVGVMRRIALKAEAHRASSPEPDGSPGLLRERGDITAAVAHGAWQVARDVKAKAVLCWSQLGTTARYLSRNNFHVPIVAFSDNRSQLRRMTLYRGVTPEAITAPATTEQFLAAADERLISQGWLAPGDTVVVVVGAPFTQPGRTNTLLVHRLP